MESLPTKAWSRIYLKLYDLQEMTDSEDEEHVV